MFPRAKALWPRASSSWVLTFTAATSTRKFFACVMWKSCAATCARRCLTWTGQFDYVTCIEGIEHIENPQAAVREFARILRAGGHLIVSTPNILNIEERLKWLFYGYTSHFKPLSREHLENLRRDYGAMEEVALHVNPVSYSELRYTLEKYGFEIRGLYRDKPKKNLWVYWPVVAIVRLLGRLTPARKRSERWTDELNSNEVLLGGNTLIVHAVKKAVTSDE